MNTYKSLTFFIFHFLLFAFCFAQVQTAQGTGLGLTKEAAIEQAKRDAVETGLGAYISSKTVVTSTTFNDNIYSRAKGFVKTFEIVNEKLNADGNWEITISAQITEILDQVINDELALQTLLNGMNRPRILFLIQEINLIDEKATDFVETRLMTMFYEKGFDVVDRQIVEALKGQNDFDQALDGNVAAAAKIGAQLGAEVIVLGTAKISSGGKFYNMYSGQANVNGKIVKTDTGEILAIVPMAHGKKPHISQSVAGTQAADQASEILGKNIIRQLIQKWSTQQSNFIKVYLVLKNADFQAYMTFESFLKAQTVSGIRNAYGKGLNDSVGEYEIEFEGKAQDLAMGLTRTSPDGLNFKITGLSGNRITVELVITE